MKRQLLQDLIGAWFTNAESLKVLCVMAGLLMCRITHWYATGPRAAGYCSSEMRAQHLAV